MKKVFQPIDFRPLMRCARLATRLRWLSAQ
jgi:hypothetical protein